MVPQSLLSRRLFLMASGGAVSSTVLAACTAPDPSFTHTAPPVSSRPARMERLLLWLPADDDRLDGAGLAAKFVKSLEPYGVRVETGRSTRLEIDRSADQKEAIEKFRPTYRLEIDIPMGASATRGSTVATSFFVRGLLYSGAGRAPLAQFQYHARSKQAPRFVDEVVEKLKVGGYL